MATIIKSIQDQRRLATTMPLFAAENVVFSLNADDGDDWTYTLEDPHGAYTGENEPASEWAIIRVNDETGKVLGYL